MKAKLVFDGQAHRLYLIGSENEDLGWWPAYNNVDKHATLTHIPNGSYPVIDRNLPRRHVASANGPYGSYGIIRFRVAGHPGIGVHSGRANARHLPGPAHPTMGCIRTTDEAMRIIAESMRCVPLAIIEVKNNTAHQARTASNRNHQHSLEGRHYA